MPKLSHGAQLKRGKNPPDRPEPVAPVPEHFAAPVFAYRGSEDHGVVSHEAMAFLTEETDAGWVDQEYVHDDPPEHVVPVRVVQDENATSGQRIVLRTFQTQLAVGDPPRLIANRSNMRKKLYVKANSNNGADVLWVGGQVSEATAQVGYPILIGNAFPEWSASVQGEVYGSIPATATGSPLGTVWTLWLAEEVATDL